MTDDELVMSWVWLDGTGGKKEDKEQVWVKGNTLFCLVSYVCSDHHALFIGLVVVSVALRGRALYEGFGKPCCWLGMDFVLYE